MGASSFRELVPKHPGKHGGRQAQCWSSSWELMSWSKGSRYKKVLGLTWAFETSKLTSRDTSLLIRSHLLIHPRQFHSLGSMAFNYWSLWGHSHSKYHTKEANLQITNFIIYLFIVHMHTGWGFMCHSTCVVSEESLVQSVLSFYYVGSRDQIQMTVRTFPHWSIPSAHREPILKA